MRTGTEVWTFDPLFGAKNRSWVGYQVRAKDGDIGKVDEMTIEAGRGSLVVDTGFWIFGKKRLLPAACVRSVNHDAKTVSVGLSKDQIKAAPDFDEIRRNESAHFDEAASYYGPLL